MEIHLGKLTTHTHTHTHTAHTSNHTRAHFKYTPSRTYLLFPHFEIPFTIMTLEPDSSHAGIVNEVNLNRPNRPTHTNAYGECINTRTLAIHKYIHIQFFEWHSKVLWDGRYFLFFFLCVWKEIGTNQLLCNQNFYFSVRMSGVRMDCRRTNYALLSIGPVFII